VTITKKSPYSIDDCLWARARVRHPGRPVVEPPDDVWTWTKNADEAPNKPAYIEIGFEKGIPLTLNGKEMDGVSLIQKMNQLAGLHGIAASTILKTAWWALNPAKPMKPAPLSCCRRIRRWKR